MIVVHDSVAYSHLAAFSDAGYKHRVSYGIYWMTLKYLSDRRIRYLDLGASAGIEENPRDGLTKFKVGWSTESRTAYLCGHIFDHDKYLKITKTKGITTMDYFPAYRKGEFA